MQNRSITLSLRWVLLLAWLGTACGAQRTVLAPQTDSQQRPLPLEAAEIVGQLLEAQPVGSGAGLLSKRFQTEARIRVNQVLVAGHAFRPALATPAELQVHFAYTLHPTETLFPESTQHLPGLEAGNLFRALLYLVGTDAQQQPIYQVLAYEKM